MPIQQFESPSVASEFWTCSKVRGDLMRLFYRIKQMWCIVQRKRLNLWSQSVLRRSGANCESRSTAAQRRSGWWGCSGGVYTGIMGYIDSSTMPNASLTDIYHVLPLYITAQWSTGIQRVFPPVAFWQKMLDQMLEVSDMSGWYTQYVLYVLMAAMPPKYVCHDLLFIIHVHIFTFSGHTIYMDAHDFVTVNIDHYCHYQE